MTSINHRLTRLLDLVYTKVEQYLLTQTDLWSGGSLDRASLTLPAAPTASSLNRNLKIVLETGNSLRNIFWKLVLETEKSSWNINWEMVLET